MAGGDPRRPTWLIPVVVVLFALGGVAVAAQRDSTAASLIAPGAALLAAGAAYVRAVYAADRIRAGWALVGAGMLANACGDLIWQILLVGATNRSACPPPTRRTS